MTVDIKDLKAKGDIQGLIKALQDSDGDVRRAAAQMLGELEDASAVEALIAVLNDDVSGNVREAAAKALSQIGGQRAIMALFEATSKLLGH